MASENTIIIDVEVNASEAAKNLSETTAKIAALKKEQKELSQFIKAGADVTGELSARYAENSQSIKDLTAQEKMYTAQLNVTTQGNTKLGDSYIEMSRTLAALKQEYRGLSAEQRDSAGGQQLLSQIQSLDKEMKAADASMGDFQRNVGNYQSALEGFGGKAFKVGQMFQGGLKNGLQAAGTAVKNFGKTLLTTPVGWITAAVAALIAVFKQLRDGFARNDDASTKMAAAMAKLKPVVTGIKNVFAALAGVVATVVDGIMKAVDFVGRLSPKYREAAKATQDYVTSQDKLEDTEREYMVAHAEREKERAELEDKARNDRSLTAEQRVELLKQSKQLAEDDLADAKRIAEEKYRLLQQEARQNADNSDEMKNRLAEAKAAMLDTQREYVEGTRRLNRQLKSSLDEIDKEQEEKKKAAAARWKEVQQARKEAAKTELDELRKLDDMTISMIADETERAIKETETSYARQIQDLQTRLNTEKNLTTRTREAINQQIIMLEAQLQRKLTDIRNAASEEERQRLIEEAQRNYDAQVSFDEENRNLMAQRMQYMFGELQQKLNTSMLEAGENARLQNDAQLQYAQSYLDQLNSMNAEQAAAMFENYQDYQLAVQEAEKAVMDAQRSSQEALQQQVNEVGSTMQAVTGALSSLFEAAAEDSEAYEKFKKAMAIVDAMISMATTIAAATTASTEGDPYTMAIRIAANVAAVTAQFAAVIKAIKAATIPSAGSFAEGGIVPGNSYTGDRMVAHTNSGEMILTRQMQLEMLKLLANGVPSSAFNYNRMKEAFTEALKEQKAPVLVYSEFEDFNNRRKKIQSITQL